MARKIVIIDDSKSLRGVDVEIFSETTYEIIEAADGPEGLKRLKQLALHADIVLVLCDVTMPA